MIYYLNTSLLFFASSAFSPLSSAFFLYLSSFLLYISASLSLASSPFLSFLTPSTLLHTSFNTH